MKKKKIAINIEINNNITKMCVKYVFDRWVKIIIDTIFNKKESIRMVYLTYDMLIFKFNIINKKKKHLN